MSQALYRRGAAMYERILVPVDGSPTSNLGLTEAIKRAKLTGARVLLLNAVDHAAMTVVPEASAGQARLFEAMADAGEEILARSKDAAAAAGVTAETKLA